MDKTQLSTNEVAKLLGISVRTVQRMIDRKVLNAWKITPGLKSVYVVDRKDVEAIIKQRGCAVKRQARR
jgi:excisionase family DNA binding protein